MGAAIAGATPIKARAQGITILSSFIGRTLGRKRPARVVAGRWCEGNEWGGAFDLHTQQWLHFNNGRMDTLDRPAPSCSSPPKICDCAPSASAWGLTSKEKRPAGKSAGRW